MSKEELRGSRMFPADVAEKRGLKSGGMQVEG